MKADNPFDLLLPAAMAKVAEEAGVYKATKHPLKTFYLAITAGVFISIAFVFLYYCDNRYWRDALWHGETYRGYLFLFGTDSLCYLRR
ncbi:formate transporter [Salmonella enterica subsp. enterica]|uniref:Formate transporter n=1 Tax=Salmonella enterica I TaxID=59201 RepID=A0A447MV41_SALET|nr:formate transporter [Salmonella enterica subsp. enterica]